MGIGYAQGGTLWACGLAGVQGFGLRDGDKLLFATDLSKWIHSDIHGRFGRSRCPRSGCRVKIKNMYGGDGTVKHSLPRVTALRTLLPR